MKDDKVSQLPNTEQPQTMPAVIVPAVLWVQIIDLLRDTPLPHKQVDPILQAAGQLLPQEIPIGKPSD